MGRFFDGWRRRVGCTLLVMACAVTALWGRSLEIIDVVNVPLKGDRAIAVSSADDAIVWRVGWNSDDPWKEYDWTTRATVNFNGRELSSPPEYDYRYDRPFPLGEGDAVDWLLIHSGFGAGQTTLQDRSFCRQFYLIIPYRFLVWPLTLLSAWLILWTPRKKSLLAASAS